MSIANAEAIEAWNTVLYDKFLRFRDTLTSGFAVHGHAVLDRFPPARGSRVLDVGCGFGDTTLEVARRVGSSGEAVGVDAAARFIEAASKDAAEAGVKNARFAIADVETGDLGGPYDQVFSRFGVMFFENPVAALRNMRRALRPGGVLSTVVWRRKDENAYLDLVEKCVLELVPKVDKGDQVTCGPGPFSMSSPDVVSAQLLKAGFERPSFERFDADIRVGTTVDDAVALAMELGPAGEVLRLAGEAAAAARPKVVAALRALLGTFAREDGIYAGSSTWIVSARKKKKSSDEIG
jgi:ubiquinone/menaquinone biosynthesis C-methylase UbiE